MFHWWEEPSEGGIPALAVGDHAGVAAVRPDLPEVVSIVYDHGPVAVRPPGRSQRRRQARRVVRLVDELDRQPFGQVGLRPARDVVREQA